MRKSPLPEAESGRIHDPLFEAQIAGECNGLFRIVYRGARLQIIASKGNADYPWEHVSVRGHGCVPTWDQMCYVKSLFWGPEECVIQFHPAEKDHINLHPHVLHLWRPLDGQIPMPPKDCV
jgi:hypothetical protein